MKQLKPAEGKNQGGETWQKAKESRYLNKKKQSDWQLTARSVT